MRRDIAGTAPWLASGAWLAGLALLLALIALHRPGVVCVQEASAGVENPAEVQAELAAWEELWAELDDKGVDALAPQVRIAGARYAGDTCGMRYRRLYRGVEAATRERLAIAAFANDAETKQGLLRPLLDALRPADSRPRRR